MCVTVADSVSGVPLVCVTLRAALEGLGPVMEEASQSLGANQLQTVVRVSMPTVLPVLLTGFALAFARIECHYFMNNAFFSSVNYLIENVGRIRSIPGVIVQGRYDVVCPLMRDWDLHRAGPDAQLHIIRDAGHSYSEPGIVDALVAVTPLSADHFVFESARTHCVPSREEAAPSRGARATDHRAQRQ